MSKKSEAENGNAQPNGNGARAPGKPTLDQLRAAAKASKSLAASGGPVEQGAPAGRNLEVDAFQRGDAAEANRDR